MDTATVVHWLGNLFNIYPDYQRTPHGLAAGSGGDLAAAPAAA